MEKKKEFMTIDGMPVEINGEKNLLELIRKAGIKMPTFCYHSELSIYGACRMCMVENKWGGLDAACSTIPKAGMEIRTNTEKIFSNYFWLTIAVIVLPAIIMENANCKTWLCVSISREYVFPIPQPNRCWTNPLPASLRTHINAFSAVTA